MYVFVVLQNIPFLNQGKQNKKAANSIPFIWLYVGILKKKTGRFEMLLDPAAVFVLIRTCPHTGEVVFIKQVQKQGNTLSVNIHRHASLLNVLSLSGFGS